MPCCALLAVHNNGKLKADYGSNRLYFLPFGKWFSCEGSKV